MAKLAKDRGVLQYRKYDNYVTSEEGWEVIRKYIPADKKVWCPFYHAGELGDLFKHKNKIHENRDFFEWDPDDFDIICDNPPYTNKREIIKRCIELGRPFALLMPLETLERKVYQAVVADNPDVRSSVIIPRNRIKFIKDNLQKGSDPCVTAWFAFNILDGDNKLIFEN